MLECRTTSSKPALKYVDGRLKQTFYTCASRKLSDMHSDSTGHPTNIQTFNVEIYQCAVRLCRVALPVGRGNWTVSSITGSPSSCRYSYKYLCGKATLQGVQQLKQEATVIFQDTCFTLYKWHSNAELEIYRWQIRWGNNRLPSSS